MKSLILKDLYNISHNVRQLLFTLLFLAVCLVPSTGSEGFAATAALICGIMTITTFSFDEKAKWAKYALIMPVTRTEYVLSKYVINVIFSCFGGIIGGILSALIGMIKGRVDLFMTAVCMIVGVVLSILVVSICIPMLIRFGTEQARIIMLGAVGIPVLAGYIGYKVIQISGLHLTEQMTACGIAGTLLIIAVVVGVSIMLSIKWMKEQEF